MRLMFDRYATVFPVASTAWMVDACDEKKPRTRRGFL
jgi:hypothetical protein